jgi:glucose/arabinose dehydrogenase
MKKPLRLASFITLISVALFGAGAMAVPHPESATASPSVKLAVVTTATAPVDIASRANESAIYIVEQDGRIVRFGVAGTDKGTRRVALNITSLTSANGERGLLGLAFHPNGKFAFINYTDNKGNTVVARYGVTTAGKFLSSTRTVIFTMKQPYANHNGGGLAFGPGGRLFIGTGDGGSGGDPNRVSLKKDSPLGKILSINPNAKNVASNNVTVWSRGLRNPWRFEFDAGGNLWVADVGQNEWEEVNVSWATDGAGKGVSYGWSALEGNARYNTDQPSKGHQSPAYVYKHGDAGCSISGGTRMRDPKIPTVKDWFVFGDYCSGRLTGILVKGNTAEKVTVLARDIGSISAVRTVANGTSYVLTLEGKILRISGR